jgi:hypothetical protein
MERARAVRAYLDGEGFARTESHLNEWNYLPDHDWSPMIASQGPAREQWYERQGGAEGAAFAAAALIGFQSAPLDAANFYSGDNQPFGLFTQHGTPKKSFYAFRAFRALLETPVRVKGDVPSGAGPWWLAGLDETRSKGAILVALPKGTASLGALQVIGLPWTGATVVKVQVLDGQHELSSRPEQRIQVREFMVSLDLAPPAVALVRLDPIQ